MKIVYNPVHKNKLQLLSTAGDFSDDFEPKNSNIQSHITSTSNPHSTTLEQARTAGDTVNGTINHVVPVSTTAQLIQDSTYNRDVMKVAVAQNSEYDNSNVEVTGGSLRFIRQTGAHASSGILRPQITFRKNRGRSPSLTAAQENDWLGGIGWQSSDGTSNNIQGAGLECFVDGAVTTGAVPKRLSFITGTNSTTRAERMTIKNDGKVGIGNAEPSELLDVAGNINFNKFKAVAMACDSGATLPTSPSEGQWFLHTPTGRKVLLQFTNGAWYPLYSFGAMTVFVDGTSGTDSADLGTGTGASAWKTLSYMWTQLPSVFYGNIVVNVAAGTYAETLTCQGKVAGGAYTITITGAETILESGTVTTGVQGTGATPGSIEDTSKSWTTDVHKGKFVRYGTAAGRVVKSNTADTLQIVGTFTAVPSGTFDIYDAGTMVEGVVVSSYQAVTFNTLKIAGTNTRILEMFNSSNAQAVCRYVVFEPTSGSRIFQSTQDNYFDNRWCIFILDGASVPAITIGQGKIQLPDCLAYQKTGTKSGTFLVLQEGASGNFNSRAFAIDNFNVAIQAGSSASMSCNSGAAAGYAFIINNGTGLTAQTGGQIISTTNNQYSGNTTDESATALSYGYID